MEAPLRILYCGFKGSGKTQNLRVKLTFLIERLLSRSSSHHVDSILLIAHPLAFDEYINMINKKFKGQFKRQKSMDRFNRCYIYNDDSIKLYFYSQIDSDEMKQLTTTSSNKLIDFKHIFYDDALIDSFDQFIVANNNSNAININRIETLMIAIDPLKNYGNNQWTSFDYDCLIRNYNLSVNRLGAIDNYEIPFDRDQLSYYVNEISSVLLCQPRSERSKTQFTKFGKLQVISRQCHKSSMVREISTIRKSIQTQAHEMLIVYDEEFIDLFKIAFTNSNTKRMSFERIEPSDMKCLIFCLPSHKYDTHFFKYSIYVYCTLTKRVKDVYIIKVKESVIENKELDELIGGMINESTIEKIDYDGIERLIKKTIEFYKLNDFNSFRINHYTFGLVQKSIKLKTLSNFINKDNFAKKIKNLKELKTKESLVQAINSLCEFKSPNATEYEIMAFQYIRSGNLKKLETLFSGEKKSAIRMEALYKGRSMLHYAICFEQLKIIEFLIKNGADVFAIGARERAEFIASGRKLL